MAQRSPEHEGLLAAVDLARAAEELLELADLELVGMRGAGHLPQPDASLSG